MAARLGFVLLLCVALSEGRRGGFLVTTGSFTLSSGGISGNRAGNTEKELKELGEDDDLDLTRSDHLRQLAASHRAKADEHRRMAKELTRKAKRKAKAARREDVGSGYTNAAVSPYLQQKMNEMNMNGGGSVLDKSADFHATLAGQAFGQCMANLQQKAQLYHYNPAQCPSAVIPASASSSGIHCLLPKTKKDGKDVDVCKANQKMCSLMSGKTKQIEKRNVEECLKVFGSNGTKDGSQIECPDGIGIKGAMDASGLCMSWTSLAKLHAGRWTSCHTIGQDATKTVMCTSMTIVHPNMCEGDSGVLAFKRIVCREGKCFVFKVGSCLRVEKKPGQPWDKKDKQGRTIGVYQFDNILEDRKPGAAHTEFAKAAMEILKLHPTGDIPEGSKYLCRSAPTHTSQGGDSCMARGQHEIMLV